MSEEIDYKMGRIVIESDESPENPRDTFDNFGTMVCFHRRYQLGDCGGRRKPHRWKQLPEFLEPDDLHAFLKRTDAIALPLYLYEHSGITISTSPFSCSWDSGQVGYIYVERERVRKELQVSRVTKEVVDRARDMLISEVKTYDDYLTGEVYGYTVFAPDGEELHSCWGYYGDDATKPDSWMIEDAKSYIDDWYAQRSNDNSAHACAMIQQ